ncbi:DUF7409 domain-containing protein [Halopiger djelfimassiliensis]|uniref:DUF7409 domain-containing protein n=1 Tax=Halopiger djelfimassiliensis TaxID=1293047 RepID=UPI0006780A03|nr:hypothetical protein [Halopiger djelfimassiliensis]
MSKEQVVGEANETGTESTGDDEDTRDESDGSGAATGSTVDIGIEVEVDVEPDADAMLEPDADAMLEPDTESRIRPDERDALEAVDIEPDAISSKEYSYRMLLDTGVDEPIAAALRRRFSLPWSFETDGDLDRRSSEVRGLGEAEREWIAVSGDEDWQAFEYTHSRRTEIGRDEPSERPWPRPTPVTAVAGVGPDDAETLAEAGIRSAERLATINASEVASLLELDVLHVRTWRHNARELVE